MRVAIKEEWRGTVHRWCKWHVLRLAKENLGLLYSKKSSGFKDKFHKLVNDMMDERELEKSWDALMSALDIGEHPFI